MIARLRAARHPLDAGGRGGVLLLAGGASIFWRPGAEPGGFPGWDDILVAVEPAEGTARPGNPGWTTLLRIWYSRVRVF